MVLPVTAVERSCDSKLSTDKGVSTTWASQASCPKSCPFRNAGCYAEHGRPSFTTRRLNQSVEDDPVAIARAEADAIRGLSGKRPLRLHVVGDCPTPEAARIVAEAAAEYASRHGQPVWTYTHAHHEVEREDWGDTVSVLASCQSVAEAEDAYERGWTPAIVVPEFESEHAYPISDKLVGIPCPHQTGKVDSCKSCGLCTHDRKMHAQRRAILFRAHGARKNNVKQIVGA